MALAGNDVRQRREAGVTLANTGNTKKWPMASVAVLSTFNVDMLGPFLREALGRTQLFGEFYFAPFGQLAQEILNSDSNLYKAQPQYVCIATAAEDLLGPVYERPSLFPGNQGEQFAQERAEEVREWIHVLLERLPETTCFVALTRDATAPCDHVFDPPSAERGQAAVERLIAEFRRFSALSARVVPLDWEWHTRSCGSHALTDDRLWYLGRMRLNQTGLAVLAELFVSHLQAHRGVARKVAALDLDNTLWGGIVGEAGLAGITLGDEGLGLAFQDFQRELLRLNDIGVVLAVCSKNNPADAWEVFDSHPGMILKREHVSASRINWVDKATNLRELSEELQLALDSFVFLDDSPVEREWVRQTLPEVLTPDLPRDPVEWPHFLRNASFFRRITVTSADRVRAESYRAQGLRSQLRSSTASLDDFIASLDQQIRIEGVNRASLARAAQMCQRTNQFNLTTRRHTVANIEAMLQDPNIEMFTVAVRDRFGDNGIVGAAILRFEQGDAVIEGFLLSCRILGRRVEDQLLTFLKERATERGARRLIGLYAPTAKNAQVANFYPERGFSRDGEGTFSLSLGSVLEAQPSTLSAHA